MRDLLLPLQIWLHMLQSYVTKFYAEMASCCLKAGAWLFRGTVESRWNESQRA